MDGGFPTLKKWIYDENVKLNHSVIFSDINLCFAGAYVENREAYNLASDQQEIMLRVGYNFDMGLALCSLTLIRSSAKTS